MPEEIRQQARRAYLLFRRDSRNPSLRFKKVDERSSTFSVRIGLGYRALGVMEGSTVIWFLDRLTCRMQPSDLKRAMALSGVV
jgi:hypothetical protein